MYDVNDSIVNDTEILFIKFFNSYWYENKKYGLNLTKGGDGGYGSKLSAEHIEKLRSANIGNSYSKGIKQSEEIKRKAARNRKNRMPDELIINVINDINNGLTRKEVAQKNNIEIYKVGNIIYTDRKYSRGDNIPKVVIEPRYTVITDDIVSKVKLYRELGMSQRLIAKELGFKDR